MNTDTQHKEPTTEYDPLAEFNVKQRIIQPNYPLLLGRLIGNAGYLLDNITCHESENNSFLLKNLSKTISEIRAITALAGKELPNWPETEESA